MFINNTPIEPVIVENIFYIIGYVGIAALLVVILTWIFLLGTFFRDNQIKIGYLLRQNNSEKSNEIAAVKFDITKLRLMMVILIFEVLTCIAIEFSLFGNQMQSHVEARNRTVNCQPLVMKFECWFLFYPAPVNVLFLCMAGYMATLALYLAKKFMNQNRNTRIIQYMTVFILIQVIVCLPLDLAEQFVAAYVYAAFNTINYILLLKGCFRLRKLLRWRAQDYNFTRYHARSQKIEKRYNLQMYTLITIYGLILSMDNLNLVVRDGILQPVSSIPRIPDIILEQVFQVLRYFEGTIWVVCSIILYSSVLKGPKFSRSEWTMGHLQ